VWFGLSGRARAIAKKATMDRLEIRLLGGMEIRRGEVLLPKFPTRNSERLFACLALNRGRPVSRDVLCGCLWSEHPEGDARKSLRNTLWRIRSVVEPTHADRGSVLHVEGDMISFTQAADPWVDTAAFESRLKGATAIGRGELDPEAVERLEKAAELYRGDFLEGHYDEWSLTHRERFRSAHLAALERLVDHHYSAGNWSKVIEWGRRLLREDPLREHVHRSVMGAHLAMGDRPLAVRQYRDCVRALRRELDIEPMDETRRLHEVIRGDRPFPSAVRRAARDAAMHEAGEETGKAAVLVDEVENALRDLYALAERLERTRRALWLRA